MQLKEEKAKTAIAIIFIIFLIINCTTSHKKPGNRIIYTEPDTIPGILFPGKVSTGLHEHGAVVFSPEEDLILWTISLNGQKIILQSKPDGHDITKPSVAAFSGQYRDEYPIFSPDGNNIYFMSWRPDSANTQPVKEFRHWQVKRSGGNWGKPELNPGFNPGLWAYSMSASGSVYGWASLEKDRNDADIYYQYKTEKGYSAPVNMGDSINSLAIEYCPFISNNEKLIVFGRMGTGEADGIYYSTRNNDGSWKPAKRFPVLINSGNGDRFPSLSSDNKVLYYNRQDRLYSPYSRVRLNYNDILEKQISDPANGNFYSVRLSDTIYK